MSTIIIIYEHSSTYKEKGSHHNTSTRGRSREGLVPKQKKHTTKMYDTLKKPHLKTFGTG